MKHQVTSEVTGKVWKILRQVGDCVQEGDEITVIESMKMEFPVTAPASGVITSLAIAEGDAVTDEQLLAEIQS